MSNAVLENSYVECSTRITFEKLYNVTLNAVIFYVKRPVRVRLCTRLAPMPNSKLAQTENYLSA
jgi:hypothetical protein